MNRQLFLILLGLLTGFSCFAQEEKTSTFFVEAAYDTIALNEQFELKFTLKNGKAIATFELPALEGFQLLAGPMTSQSMSIINGDMTQSMSYSYILQPTSLGVYNILATSIETETGILLSEDIAIVVVEKIEHPKENGSLNNAFNDPFKSNPFFNDPFFNQEQNPRQGMDDMMKNLDDMFKTLPPEYYSKPSPKEKPKKKEKVYKI
jgi:hypothetical protein